MSKIAQLKYSSLSPKIDETTPSTRNRSTASGMRWGKRTRASDCGKTCKMMNIRVTEDAADDLENIKEHRAR